MPRGDKNKQGTSGRAGSFQSSRDYSGSRQQKSSQKRQTGGWSSDPEETLTSQEVYGTRTAEAEQQLRPSRIQERKFNLVVDNVPYMVKATAFSFNGETRYRVSFSGSSEHVFTWDSSVRQFRAIDDDASTLPDNLEEAISEKLQLRS